MSLQDTTIRNAKPRTKPYKLSDGEGLFLVVVPSGSKYWRLRYFFGGKEKLLALGVYPHISLAEARERRAQARKLLAHGTDPGEAKKEAKRQVAHKATSTFEAVAKEWLAKKDAEWTPRPIGSRLPALETYVFLPLGPKPVDEITEPQVLAMPRPIEAKGILHTPQRMMQLTGQVFMYAIATGRAERNPVPD